MYTFINRLGTMDDPREVRKDEVSQKLGGVANKYNDTNDTALPINVCGREKSHNVFIRFSRLIGVDGPVLAVATDAASLMAVCAANDEVPLLVGGAAQEDEPQALLLLCIRDPSICRWWFVTPNPKGMRKQRPCDAKNSSTRIADRRFDFISRLLLCSQATIYRSKMD
jgi:hypothetical protein